ncbi:MAG: BamA/TamA family outer membrane protein [Rhabdochlamydiaceae bacterium]|nr:BamA/TamA family outer membrane protein [Rhabdochlamydiaceae bacterium]
MQRRFKTLLLSLALTLLPIVGHAGGIHYSVEFEGLDDDRTLKAIKSISSLTSLKKRLPASLNALRYRAESDVPDLIKVLHAHGYYEAEVSIRVLEIYNRILVVVSIDPGPLYPLESYDIHLYCDSSEETTHCCSIGLSEIDIQLGKPARSAKIIDAELKLLDRLSERGYPLATVEDRKIIVDGKTKSVRVTLDVKTGQKSSFGTTTIVGNDSVKPLYIQHKINWKENECYNSDLVENTQNTLMETGLFSSVYITHEEQLNAQGQLPMKIEVTETKHKSVNVGVSYQTVFGPGVTFGWENRNVAGMGRRFTLQGDITRISHSGIATYFHPDFKRVNQDLVCQGQAAHESLPVAYSMRSYSLMTRFERRFGKRVRLSLGVQGERLFVTASAHNGNYWLLEGPIYLRLSTANSLLDPTKGATIEFTTTPSMNVGNPNQLYLIQQASESSYHPLNKRKSIVFAQQLTLGTIWSPQLNSVPLNKRFLGGSEQNLRGYRYQTVSPLRDEKPIGGRSAIFFTLETRFRISPSIGLVPFFDMGNVYLTQYPSWHGKWFKSTGIGLRYYSFMGPFRLDVAFPLNRRKEIDPVYKVLVSIGQTF